MFAKNLKMPKVSKGQTHKFHSFGHALHIKAFRATSLCPISWVLQAVPDGTIDQCTAMLQTDMAWRWEKN